jgi:hypothetical protein
MNLTKRVLPFLLVVLLAFAIPVSADAEIIDSGSGEGIAWELTDDGTLTISGQGSLDALYLGLPKVGVLKIVVKPGITMIAGSALAYFPDVTHIVLPNTVTIIGNYAFEGDRCIRQRHNCRFVGHFRPK